MLGPQCPAQDGGGDFEVLQANLRLRAARRIAANLDDFFQRGNGDELPFEQMAPALAHEAQVPARLLKYVITVGCSVYGVQNLVIYGLGEYWRGPARLAQGVARHFEITSGYSDDFIDRMTGKVTAVLVGIVWNFLFFKYFVYA